MPGSPPDSNAQSQPDPENDETLIAGDANLDLGLADSRLGPGPKQWDDDAAMDETVADVELDASYDEIATTASTIKVDTESDDPERFRRAVAARAARERAKTKQRARSGSVFGSVMSLVYALPLGPFGRFLLAVFVFATAIALMLVAVSNGTAIWVSGAAIGLLAALWILIRAYRSWIDVRGYTIKLLESLGEDTSEMQAERLKRATERERVARGPGSDQA